VQIEIMAFNPVGFFEIAIDRSNGRPLIGIPFDVGPAGHCNYYVISDVEYRQGLADPRSLDHLVSGQDFRGSGRLYHSTWAHHPSKSCTS
jgi:hypothetical protein